MNPGIENAHRVASWRRSVLLVSGARGRGGNRCFGPWLSEAGAYRWVGIYEVGREEIALAAWSGPGEPAHLRLPITEGLCGAAVREKRSIAVADVAADARYRTTFPSTRSEIVVPILDVVDGHPRGVIDVESDRVDAFGEDDRMLLEHCAAEIAAEFSPSPG